VYASFIPDVRPTDILAIEPLSVVACRKAEQPGECEDAEETETVPVTAVKGVNGARVPDSKLVAAAVVPG
jgi:hypothetical protein